jgi:hypothetical protein
MKHHPLREAYELYQKMPYDRETWDLTAVLYAVRPDSGYFGRRPARFTSTIRKSRSFRHRNRDAPVFIDARSGPGSAGPCSSPVSRRRARPGRNNCGGMTAMKHRGMNGAAIENSRW